MTFLPPSPEKVRIDKYLWSVRLFKSRSLATDACLGGKIKINGISTKPSREVKIDEIITIRLGVLEKKIKVLALLDKRVSAQLVELFCEDLTPDSEYEKLKIANIKFEKRDQGIGRPTKKDYRQIEYMKWYLNIEDEELLEKDNELDNEN